MGQLDFSILREHLKKIKLVIDKNTQDQVVITKNHITCFNHNYMLSIPFDFDISKQSCFFVENEFVEILLKDVSLSGRLEKSLNSLKIETESGFDAIVPAKDLNINFLPMNPNSDFLSIPIPLGFIDKLVSCKPFILKTTDLSQYQFAWLSGNNVFSSSADTVYCNKINEKLDNLNDTFSLTVKNIDILKKLKPVEYRVSDSWAIFKCLEGEILMVRQYNFDCPVKLLNEFQNFQEEFVIKFPFDILDDIQKFLVINGKNSSHIKVSIENEIAVLDTINTKIKASKKVNVKANFESRVEFFVNPKILQNSISISNTMLINKDLNVAKFQNFNEEQLIGLGV